MKKKNNKKFKIGDIVICINEVSGNKYVLNKIGKIINFKPYAGDYTIEFFEDIKGHNADYSSKEGCCWCVREQDIKLYNPTLKKFIEEMEKNEK